MVPATVVVLVYCAMVANARFTSTSLSSDRNRQRSHDGYHATTHESSNTGVYVLAAGVVGFVAGGFFGNWYATEQFKRVPRSTHTGDGASEADLERVEASAALASAVQREEQTAVVLENLRRDKAACSSNLKELQQHLASQTRDFGKAYNMLYGSHERIKQELMARDYEEFKVPDTDDDDIVTFAEFMVHSEAYKNAFPTSVGADFPDFNAIDLDGDRNLTFEEWQHYVLTSRNSGAGTNEGTSGHTAIDANSVQEEAMRVAQKHVKAAEAAAAQAA